MLFASLVAEVAKQIIFSSSIEYLSKISLYFFKQFKADYALIGISGIEEDGTLLDFDFQEVCVSQEILSSARQVFLAADSSKFGRNAMIRLGSLKQVDCIFTDQQPNEEYMKTIRELDVGLIVAK